MAATNRADILDSALLRPGRFDRQIYVGMPDIKGREEILKIHSRGKALAEDVNLKDIARSTAGFTGADLENLMNESALLAARRSKPFITMREIEDATIKVIAGPEKKSRVVTEKDRRLTAYHEAGHAVVSHWLKHVDPVHEITIIPHGQAGGMTIFRPTEDKSFKARSEMFEQIVMALGGRVSESLFLDDISTGASGDIQQATTIARNMVTVYGMSDRLGPISFDSSEHSIFIGRDFGQTKSYSEETASIIDEEVKSIFDENRNPSRRLTAQRSPSLRKAAPPANPEKTDNQKNNVQGRSFSAARVLFKEVKGYETWYSRPAQRGQIYAFQRHHQRRSRSRELPLLHHRAQRGHGHRAG
jgi:cell division protease FtsH